MTENAPKPEGRSGMLTKAIILLLLAAGISAAFYAKAREPKNKTESPIIGLESSVPAPETSPSPNATDTSPSQASTEAPSSEEKPAPLPRLIELGSVRCIPCRMMAPILDELKKEYDGKLKVEFIDVWEYPDAAEKFSVRAIPTQVIVDSSGKEVFRHTGFYPKDQIVAKLKQLGILTD
ncbi:MAG TPA: thioredoxin domain-containing protein [Candidatus Hydrogenedentes bacterium]|nr:thioredoxin domain-containing protein [Candidatus Hydrogenedentota bacterium]HOL78378.1 thioredoxin domain-containing protein [Candidatus Hydrogenedentota bacterium]HPO87601.1 thioredoxin domain-containing protein [Candidatus Hydrogenedentota bacterium]